MFQLLQTAQVLDVTGGGYCRTACVSQVENSALNKISHYCFYVVVFGNHGSKRELISHCFVTADWPLVDTAGVGCQGNPLRSFNSHANECIFHSHWSTRSPVSKLGKVQDLPASHPSTYCTHHLIFNLWSPHHCKCLP